MLNFDPRAARRRLDSRPHVGIETTTCGEWGEWLDMALAFCNAAHESRTGKHGKGRLGWDTVDELADSVRIMIRWLHGRQSGSDRKVASTATHSLFFQEYGQADRAFLEGRSELPYDPSRPRQPLPPEYESVPGSVPSDDLPASMPSPSESPTAAPEPSLDGHLFPDGTRLAAEAEDPGSPSPGPFTGRTLDGRYRISDRLGAGGMATVYRARDERLGRDVVVKIPHAHLLNEPTVRERFEREIRSQVKHDQPGIVSVLDAGRSGDTPYMVLPYLVGGSLAERLVAAGGALPVRDVEEWLVPLASTLDALHEQGLVHRDVKPGNILFDAHGHPQLADFGVAKALESQDATLTATGMGVGSLQTMAPEQCKGEVAGPRADQYALAATMYEALSGAPAFDGSPLEILIAKATRSAPALHVRAPGVPRAACAAVTRSLALEPRARFASCTRMAEAFVHGSARVDSASETVSRRVVVAATVVALALAVGAWFLAGGSREASEEGGGAALGRGPEDSIGSERPESAPAASPIDRQAERGEIESIGGPDEDSGDVRSPEGPASVPTTATIQSPVEGAWVRTRRVLIRGQTSGDGASLLLNGEVLQVVDGVFEHEWEVEKDGRLRIQVGTADGRLLSERTVHVDTNRPLIEISSPTENRVLSERSLVRVVGRVSEAHLASLDVNGAPITVDASGHFSWPLVLEPGKETVLRFEAQDRAGNEAVGVTRTFTYENPMEGQKEVPEPPVHEPEDGATAASSPKARPAITPVPSALPFGDPDGNAPKVKAPRSADQLLAETAAKRGDWATVVRLTRGATTSQPALRALNRNARAWAHGRLAFAVRSVRAERYEDARIAIEDVIRAMSGEPESVDAQRGLVAIEHMRDLSILPEESPLRSTVRKTAYEKMRGTRWAPLFSDVPIPRPEGLSADSTPTTDIGYADVQRFFREMGRDPGDAPHEKFWELPYKEFVGLSFPFSWDQADLTMRLLVPGDAKASNLIKALTTGQGITVTDPAGNVSTKKIRVMPKRQSPMNDDKIARLSAWIDAGCPEEATEPRRAAAKSATPKPPSDSPSDFPAPAPPPKAADSRLKPGVPAWARVSGAQKAEAKKHGVEVAFENTIGMRFVLIPAGEFWMGSPTGEEGRYDDELRHRVTLTQPYYMSIHEVTNGQYRRKERGYGGFASRTNRPVEGVSWKEATEFARWLSSQDASRTYVLPTEAKWEYACRAGTTTPFSFGETISTDQVNYNGGYTYGRGRKGVYRGKTLDVGSLALNAWGLYDMHGNVAEWCRDWFGPYSSSGVPDPKGPTNGRDRVLRGGYWISLGPRFVRSAYRVGVPGGNSEGVYGFRLVVSLSPPGSK